MRGKTYTHKWWLYVEARETKDIAANSSFSGKSFARRNRTGAYAVLSDCQQLIWCWWWWIDSQQRQNFNSILLNLYPSQQRSYSPYSISIWEYPLKCPSYAMHNQYNTMQIFQSVYKWSIPLKHHRIRKNAREPPQIN